VSVELANKAYAYLLTVPTDAIDLVIKADLFMYNIIAKLCYIFIVFIRIMVNTGVFKKSTINYKQF
jgi:hypothetical protein